MNAGKLRSLFGTVIKSPSNKVFDVVMLALLLMFSFYLTFKAGERGFFAFDQSIIFDGAYRILSGQIPYKDFLTSFGPVLFWFQAIFFKLLGVNYSSYIFGAAFTNVLATICSISILRLLFPSHRVLSYIAGFVTAIWFYPPSGTPAISQTAFFFSLLTITVLLHASLAAKPNSAGNGLLLSISGCLVFLSFMSKQNAGLFILPLCFLLLIGAYIPDLKRGLYSCAIFSTGFIASIIAFFLWLWLKSDIGNFFEYFYTIPGRLGSYRLEFLGGWSGLLRTFTAGIIGRDNLFDRLIIVLVMRTCFFAALFWSLPYIYNFRKVKDTRRRQFLSCIVCLYFVFFQYLFIATTRNQEENGWPFVGIILAIGIALLFDLPSLMIKIQNRKLISLSRKAVKIVLLTGILVSVYSVSKAGIEVSLYRRVQDTVQRSKFPKYFTEEKLKGLKWGQPTRVKGANIEEDEIVSLIGYLRAKNKNFFIFPDFTIFYGLLDVPSPQPVVWFAEGQTYCAAHNADLDRWIVGDLKKNTVEIVVLEGRSRWFGTHNRLDDFPQLSSYITEDFSKVEQIGIFNIYEKKRDKD
jgi:4-amino-4-deoxy-L-arabinose transferase-like glycosyltransferase